MTKVEKEKREERADARSSALTRAADVRRSSGRDIFCYGREEHASFPHPQRRGPLKGTSLSARPLLADCEKLTRSSRQRN
jgi:hypothetical protein